MRMSAEFEVLGAESSASGRMAAKRAIDLAAAAIGLLLLIPLFAFIAVAIPLDDRGPVFYRQTRVGRLGRPFQIHKFRSMSATRKAAGPNLTIAGDPRITRVGRVLRQIKF